MKPFSIILFGCFLQIIPLMGQNLLVPGNQWIYEYNHYSMLHFAYIGQSIRIMTIAEDTVVNGITYSKVTGARYHPCSIYNDIEFLREDGEKIYRLSHDKTTEYLMIDFSEAIGYEMLFEHEGGIDTGYVEVDSFGIEYTADQTAFDVQYMRIINNQAVDEYSVYEVYRNVGFTQGGMLFPILGNGLCDVYDYIVLRCHVAGQDTTHFTEHGCFENTFISSTHSVEPTQLTLSPNPTFDIIQIPDGLVFKDLINAQGQQIVPSLSDKLISLESCIPGIYFVRLQSQDGEKMSIGRVIKL